MFKLTWLRLVIGMLLLCCSFMAAQSPPPAHATLAHRILVPIAARDAAFGDFWSDTERQTVAEINRRRQENGCRAATLNRELSVAAKRHSKAMAAKNFLSHTGSDGSSPFQRIQQAGYRYSKAGEIIAAGYTTPESVVQGWMNSSGHKAIMLDCDYQDIGIGLEYNPHTGWRYFWTVTFGQRR